MEIFLSIHSIENYGYRKKKDLFLNRLYKHLTQNVAFFFGWHGIFVFIDRKIFIFFKLKIKIASFDFVSYFYLNISFF